MIKMFKKWLGLDLLEKELVELREEREAFKAERTTLESELSVYRIKEAKDQEKYDSTVPWVEIKSDDVSEIKGMRIELDWNEAFIQQLKESGIQATEDEEYVQKWLAFLYRDLIERLEAKVVDIKDETREEKISDYL